MHLEEISIRKTQTMNEKQEIFISDVLVIEDIEDEKINCGCWAAFQRLFKRKKRKTGAKKMGDTDNRVIP